MIKAKWWACQRLKTNKEENLAKYVGSVYEDVKKAEKIERITMRKVGTSRKSKTHN